MVVTLPLGGAKADEVQPRATTTWLFNQFSENDVVSTIATTESTKGQLYLYDKLYFCIGDGSTGRTRTITATAATAMPNSSAPSVNGVTPFPEGSYVGLKFNAQSRTPADARVDATSQYMLAGVKPIVAGKLYVLINTNTSGQNVSIYEGNTEKVKANRTTSDWILMSCDVTADKRYFIGCQGGADWVLYGVKFVPTTDVTDLGVHDISVSVSNGYATFSSACNYRVPAGYKAYVVSSVDGTSATLTKVDHIPSNTGVILIGDSKTTETIIMKNIRESDITDSDKTNSATNYLVANVGEYALAANNGSYYNYTLAYSAGPTFMHSNGSGTLAANKAFLRTTVNVTGGGAPALHLVFDEENNATAISNADETVQAEKFFQDGKLFIRRNGVVYDLTGAVVK